MGDKHDRDAECEVVLKALTDALMAIDPKPRPIIVHAALLMLNKEVLNAVPLKPGTAAGMAVLHRLWADQLDGGERGVNEPRPEPKDVN